MKIYQLITASLCLILLICVSGVEGQHVQYSTSYGYAAPNPISLGHAAPNPISLGHFAPNPISTRYATNQISGPNQTADVSQYSQYYTMGTVLNTHIMAPEQFNISGNTPATIYFSYQQQPMAYSQYQSNLTHDGESSLWIKGTASWAQYVAVPQKSSISLLALSSEGGEGYINELDPNGKINQYNFYFYPTSLLGFYADAPGRYVLSFVLDGRPSNEIIIDVVGTYTAPSYYNPPSYYSGYYPYYWNYYPYCCNCRILKSKTC